jgi:hypothetical protein
MNETVSVEAVVTRAQLVLHVFYDAVVACGFTHPVQAKHSRRKYTRRDPL